MLATSKINIINKENPTKEYFEGKKKIIQQRFYIEKNEEFFIISHSNYTNKKGFFIIGINKKDEVFTIDSTECDYIGELQSNTKMKYKNETPKFPIQTISILDLL